MGLTLELRTLPLPPRAWGWLRRAREQVEDLSPVDRTALRVPGGQRSPAPDAFDRFGDNSWLVPPVHVHNPASILVGSNVVIMENGRLLVLDGAGGARIHIGDGVRLARFNTIVCGVEVILQDRVSSSDSVMIHDTWAYPSGGSAALDGRPPAAGPVVIEEGAYLGYRSCIWPGVRVGKGAYIGEGAVVTDDVPAHSVVYGNPARVVCRYETSSGRWESSE